jgi:hypothetical protein
MGRVERHIDGVNELATKAILSICPIHNYEVVFLSIYATALHIFFRKTTLLDGP